MTFFRLIEKRNGEYWYFAGVDAAAISRDTNGFKSFAGWYEFSSADEITRQEVEKLNLHFFKDAIDAIDSGLLGVTGGSYLVGITDPQGKPTGLYDKMQREAAKILSFGRRYSGKQ